MKGYIKRGNVVMLNSGGPHMTIEKGDGKMAECVWITDSYMGRGSFHRDCLKEVGEINDLRENAGRMKSMD